MKKNYLKNLQDSLKCTYGCSYAKYSFIDVDGFQIVEFESCKEILDNLFYDVAVGTNGNANFVNQDRYTKSGASKLKKRFLDYDSPNIVFMFPPKVTDKMISNSLRLVNDTWEYLKGKNGFKIKKIKGKDKKIYHLLLCPKKLYHMPPILSLVVMSMRSGLYYKDDWREYWSAFVRSSLNKDHTNHEDSEYINAEFFDAIRIIKQFGLYKAFAGTFKQIWENIEQGSGGITHFSENPSLPWINQ